MRVLRTVGLMGEGEMGVRGRGRRGERAAVAVWWAAEAAEVLIVGRARASLGRVARAASILIECLVVGD